MHERITLLIKMMKYVRIKRLFIILCLFICGILSVINILNTLLYKYLIDQVMINGYFHLFIVVFGGFLILTLLKVVINHFKATILERKLLKIKNQLKKRLFFCIFNINLNQINKKNPIDLKTLVDEDADSFGYFLERQIIYYTTVSTSIIVTCVASYYINSIMAFACTLFFIISYYQTKGLREKYENNSNELRSSRMKIQEEVRKEVTFWGDIKSYSAEDVFILEFVNQRKRISSHVLKQRIYEYVNYYLAILNNALISDFFVYLVGAVMIFLNRLSIGSFLVFLQFYNALVGYVKQVTELNLEFVKQQISVNNIISFFEGETSKREKAKIEGGDYGILMKDVCFAYDCKEIIKNFNFEFCANGKYWLHGNSGVGKSTLLSLIVGELVPQKGIILYSGQDIQKIEEGEYLKNVCMISKLMKIFNTSIRENLIFVAPEATEDVIINACKKAQFWEYIETLNDGIDTIIGENGIRISGGQKQRLLVARAFLSGAKIMILDEATSEIDAQMEEKIFKELISRKDITLIVVSHRKLNISDLTKIEVS